MKILTDQAQLVEINIKKEIPCFDLHPKREFKNVNVSTRENFEKHIEHVINNYTSFKELYNGRSAYWHEASGTVVIRNPKANDGETAFQPKDGRKYFDEKLKQVLI